MILKLAFSSPSPSTLTLRAVSTASFYSSIFVAIEYSMMSMSAAPSVSLLFNRVKMDFVFSNSSMKLISRIYLKLLSISTDTQNMIGAAFLKFYQKSVSSHSSSNLLRIFGSGGAEKLGVGVVSVSLLTASSD